MHRLDGGPGVRVGRHARPPLTAAPPLHHDRENRLRRLWFSRFESSAHVRVVLQTHHESGVHERIEDGAAVRVFDVGELGKQGARWPGRLSRSSETPGVQSMLHWCEEST
jgi:hypothetical protein